MQCYTTQRDPSVFADPEEFNPQRWIGQDDSGDSLAEPVSNLSADAKEMFMPFSKGTRTCLGKSLALMELKLITATVVRQFAVELPPSEETDLDDGMEMRDHFLAFPKGKRCDLVFRKR
jgi:cytochrome P450